MQSIRNHDFIFIVVEEHDFIRKAFINSSFCIKPCFFSHEIKYKAPEGVTVSNDKMIVVVSGISKQKVGQVAAEIRALKKPEPYKGKGIMYEGEQILRKAGKTGKK